MVRTLLSQTDKGYNDANFLFANIIKTEDNLRLFLRYATAPAYGKDQARAEFNAALKRLNGIDDTLAFTTPDMNKWLSTSGMNRLARAGQ